MIRAVTVLPEGVLVRPADWSVDQPALASLRRTVFIDEQAVPEALEWEAQDPACDWLIAEADGQGVGCARLTPAGRIGRMAVLPGWCGRGIGAALLDAALARARQRGYAEITLHAQAQAIGFYARVGFQPVGPVFTEAGIPHQAMVLTLTRDKP